jgi:ADP-ribosyltransferase exoenzyme
MRLLEIKINDGIIKQIEQEILGFAVMQPKYYSSLRQEDDYKANMEIVLPLVKKFGIDGANAIYRAVKTYIANFYGRMNNSLRSGKIPKNTNLIDAYVATAPKYKGNVLYRGLDRDFFNSLKIGEVITDPAFMSTTANLKVALYFSKKRKVGGVLEITGVSNAAAKSPNLSEAEYILPRNSSLKIVSITGKTVQAVLL